MKIGIIGAGMIGSTLAKLWSEAGHEIFISSRHPDKLDKLTANLSHTKFGTVEEAAKFGEVVVVTVPLKAVPEIGKKLNPLLKDKIVIDTNNPYPDRDGEIANKVRKEENGSGVWFSKYFPDSKIVKAFNTVYYKVLLREAHRTGDKIGIPLASDSEDALETVSKLVTDSGFEPAIVGTLRTSKQFDVGTKVYTSNFTVKEIRSALGIDQY